MKILCEPACFLCWRDFEAWKLNDPNGEEVLMPSLHRQGDRHPAYHLKMIPNLKGRRSDRGQLPIWHGIDSAKAQAVVGA
jgi:hypothetical protein